MFRDFATENSAPPPCRGDRVPVDVRVLREERVELCEVRPRPDGGGENEGEGEGQRGQGLVEGVHLNKHGARVSSILGSGSDIHSSQNFVDPALGIMDPVSENQLRVPSVRYFCPQGLILLEMLPSRRLRIMLFYVQANPNRHFPTSALVSAGFGGILHFLILTICRRVG